VKGSPDVTYDFYYLPTRQAPAWQAGNTSWQVLAGSGDTIQWP
jgi:hypothetical protein